MPEHIAAELDKMTLTAAQKRKVSELIEQFYALKPLYTSLRKEFSAEVSKIRGAWGAQKDKKVLELPSDIGRIGDALFGVRMHLAQIIKEIEAIGLRLEA